MNNRDHKIQVQWMDPQALTPYANNHKMHGDKEVDRLAGQIASFGFDQPIVVDANLVVVKGHRRRLAAMKLGMKEVPVVVADHLDEYQTAAARIADNKVAGDSEINKDMLRFELGTLQRNDFDLNLTGFSLGEIEKLLDATDDAASKKKKEKEKSDAKTANQFIVSIHCADENEMQAVFEEMSSRGLECKLIT